MSMSRGKNPTRKEVERIVACKEGPCVACVVREQKGEMYASDVQWWGEYHHLLSGGRRRGHRFGVNLCQFHHRRVPMGSKTVPQTRMILGPSLMDGSKTFHAAYGSDEELLAMQDKIIGWQE